MFAPAIGGQLFNIIFGAVYDREAAKQGQAICSGSICFQDTFIVGIFASLLCMAMLSLAIYKKKLYKRTSFYYY
jgi:hypothetical protein